FLESTTLIWDRGLPFESFLRFSDWLYAASGRTNGIALKRLAELLFRFLVYEIQCDVLRAAGAVWNDYRRSGRSDRPEFLRPYLAKLEEIFATVPNSVLPTSAAPPRQSRHAAAIKVKKSAPEK